MPDSDPSPARLEPPAPPRRPLAILLPGLGWVVGVAGQLQQPELNSAAAYAACGAAALALAVLALGLDRPLRRTKWGRMHAHGALWIRDALLLSAALALGFAWAGWRATERAAQRLDAALEAQDLDVVGWVSALPQRNESGVRFRLAVESARRPDGAPVVLPPDLALGWYSGWGAAERAEPGARPVPSGVELLRQPQELRPGERWQMRVRLKVPHGGVNPHGFDYELWLWEQGIGATGYVRAGQRDPPPRRLEDGLRYPVERARWSVRDAIYQRVQDPKLAGIVAALVLGDQAAIDKADWDVFRATGVAHLMAISGLHVTLFAWLAAALLGRAWRQSGRLCLMFPSPLAGLVGGVFCAVAYAVFAGWGIPAQRTVWMLAVVALLRLGERRWPWPATWLLACVVVLAWDPWAILQAGFWLSFVAVGILFASGPRVEANQPKTAHSSRLMSGVADLAGKSKQFFREQWLITLALTPLSLLLFGQVSVVGLLANAVAIPWVTLLVTPLGLLGAVWPPAWTLAAWSLDLLGAVLRPMSEWSWAVWSGATPPVWAGALGVGGGLLLALRLPGAFRWCGLLALWPALTWTPARPAPGQFELLAWDVGQGNAVLIRTHAHSLLYDAGPRYSRETDAGHRVLVPGLRALGERIDRVVLSHRDSDHTGGAAAVLAQQTGADLLASLPSEHEMWRLASRTSRCDAGQRWSWDGVVFEVLHPVMSEIADSDKPNSVSCVIRIQASGASALLVGDIEAAQEARLLARGAPLRADLLLVPHHGSKTSSSGAFLDAVAPRLAVVQAGYRNRFGHPAAEVLARYEARGIRVEDSARCGALLWSTQDAAKGSETMPLRCLRREDTRYWRHRPP